MKKSLNRSKRVRTGLMNDIKNERVTERGSAVRTVYGRKL